MKVFTSKYVAFWIPIVMIIVLVPTVIFFTSRNKGDNQESTNSEDNQNEEINVEGTIVVEAGDGVLIPAQYDSYSYVDESARGLEAYIASRGSSVIYKITSEYDGRYTLWVKLSDDGVHESDTRSVTILINDSQTLEYKHYSEDTKGWKWYNIGDINIVKGENSFSFTKNATTSAAYVMDEFRLVPVKE